MSEGVHRGSFNESDLKPSIHMDGLSVKYRVPREKVSGIKEFAIRWVQRRLEHIDFWALNEVSMDIQRGEVFGIIGHNGAGKSTLLKIVAGLLHPTEGRVVVRGRVAPLLDLGAGFHPELTGRENVYLYGTLLGMNRHELDQRFESIVDFADLWEFIDAPLRTYSTGMTARLGFSVATCRLADVLLVDEVLAVGDVHFQEKCLERMDTFRERGATILFVTHALDNAKEICNRAMWLSEGRVMDIGPVRNVVDQYIKG